MIPLAYSDNAPRLRRPSADFAGRLQDVLSEIEDIRERIGAGDPASGPLCQAQAALGRARTMLRTYEADIAKALAEEAAEQEAPVQPVAAE